MATGAGDRYWAERALPSVFKRTLLDKYLPPFAGMTGSRSDGRRVVFLDGFAGRGRYADGKPASAERIMKIAQEQHTTVGLTWDCYFVEQDEESAAVLRGVVDQYVASGITASAHHGNILDVLPRVLRAASGCPLFAFLDPCGLGIPFDDLSALLNDDRKTSWPPTEFLLNFSLDAVRRIGGHVASSHGNPAALSRIDQTVGGRWWREHFADGVTDEGVEGVVCGFRQRLATATGIHVVSVPVRRAPGHKPVYHLIFGTRSQHGLWVFSDAVARSTQEWWDTLEEVEAEQDPGTLFTVASTVRPQLESVEAQALPVMTDSLARLLVQHPEGFRVVDHAPAVFGPFYGQVRDTVVRQAVKALQRRGLTSSTGVGGKARDLNVRPIAITV